MFGYAAFAQPAFAALGSSIYVVSISEGATLADLSLGQATFNTVLIEAFTGTDSSSVITSFIGQALEPITSTDSSTVVKTQFAVINEPQSIADAALGIANFVGFISESILSEADSEAVVATFITYITEAFVAADTPSTTINMLVTVSENVTLQDINDVVATFRYSAVENINLTDAPLGFAWVKIDNTESTQWVLIDNRQ